MVQCVTKFRIELDLSTLFYKNLWHCIKNVLGGPVFVHHKTT